MSYEITQESAPPTTARAQRPGEAESRRGLSERGGRRVEARSLSKSLLCMVVGMPPVPGTSTILFWSATGVVAQPRTATCGRITWHNVVREHHFLLSGAPAGGRVSHLRVFTVLSCLSESQIDRESEKHSFYGKILVLRKWA